MIASGSWVLIQIFGIGCFCLRIFRGKKRKEIKTSLILLLSPVSAVDVFQVLAYAGFSYPPKFDIFGLFFCEKIEFDSLGFICVFLSFLGSFYPVLIDNCTKNRVQGVFFQ
jgi:hypothetical protein